MYVPDIMYVVISLGGAFGVAWSDRTRFGTFITAAALFFINLYTTIGGGFSWLLALTTAGLLVGTLLWLVLDIGATAVSYVAAITYNLTTPRGHVQVPDTSTTNLRDVFIDSDDPQSKPIDDPSRYR